MAIPMKGDYDVQAVNPVACPGRGQSKTNLRGAALAAVNAGNDCGCAMRITSPLSQTVDVEPGSDMGDVIKQLQEMAQTDGP